MSWPRLCEIVAVILASVFPASAQVGNPPPSQLFYVPFPEDQQLQGFRAISSVAVEPVTVFVTLAASTDDTVIYYDHWEDGYERDITRPVQSTTRIFGDGNPANGSPPGNPADRIPAGTVFNLRNFVTTTTLQAVVDYDARDKIASFKPISVTKTTIPGGTNTLLAGCVEMLERGLWGVEYRAPVGVDMPTTTATATLANDQNLFNHTAFAISAGPGGASVRIDKDNNGVFEETVALAEGEAIYRDNVNVGGHVLADRPVQVILFTGTLNSTYASRDSSLLPAYRWGSEYLCPVSTSDAAGTANRTVVFLHNPNASAITVSYQYRSSNTAYITSTINVPARGNARVTLLPANGTNRFGAYRFFTTGANPPVFNAIGAIDADGTSSIGWDGGFTLVTKSSLTTQVQVSLGIGRDPYSSTGPDENGNPVWITTSGNGNNPATVYVDHNGDNAGPLIDPNGNRYDVSYSLRELQQRKIFDPDGDQSGMLVYTLDPAVRIAAVWGQDPSVASYAQPGLDVASLVPPLREGAAGKKSELAVDADADGVISAGDTLEYDLRALNTARTSIPGPFTVKDALPADTLYVPGSTRYRFTSGGAWQTWTSVADDSAGTPFPLDGAGLAVPGTIPAAQQLQIVFRTVIDDYADLSSALITNSGQIEISPYGLNLDIGWTDIVHGSIGDCIWHDLDGDGIQDAGEPGIPGITVHADQNNNGSREAGEPFDVSGPDGAYLVAGLEAGTHVIRVSSQDIAAAGAGYGPTHDFDGISSSYSATLVLGGAQDRVDADFGFRAGAGVGDRIWADRNNDRIQDPDEAGISGVRVYLDLNGNNAFDGGEPNSISSGDGGYVIGNLLPGSYDVRVDVTTLPSGATQTHDPVGGLDHEAQAVIAGAEHLDNLDFGYRGARSIGDLVWNDVNANGSSSGESGIAGVRVYIDSNNNGVFDPTEPNATTNAAGSYSIGNLFQGDHVVRVDTTTLPASFFPTHDLTAPVGDHGALVTLAGSNRTDADFGYRNDASLGDLVWNDRDADGVRDAGEPGIGGVTVYIDSNNNNFFDFATERFAIADVDGHYLIENLAAGSYNVRVDFSTLPQGSVQTHDLSGGLDHEAARTITATENADNVDFGYRSAASVGDRVWNDANFNGVIDGGEAGIASARVFLDINGDGVFQSATEPSAVTNSSGTYAIGSLMPGTFTVRVEVATLPAGLTPSHDLTGELDHAATFSLSANQVRTDLDFGYTERALVGDFIWHDLNGNGRQDPGEPGLPDVPVSLVRAADSAIVGAASSGPSGAYQFNNLLPGSYHLIFDVPAGYRRTAADVGDDSGDSDADASSGVSATFSVVGGQTLSTLDAGFHLPGTVSGSVLVDTDLDGTGDGGLGGVGLSLLDADGDPVPGEGGGPLTTVSAGDGSYAFSGLVPGSYRVVQTQPAGYDSAGDSDGADNNLIGDETPIVVVSGGTSGGNDFIEAVDTCPDDWAEWKSLYPGEVASGDPDGDSHDNLVEFAFALNPLGGAGDPFRLQPSETDPGSLELVFTRPAGATENVVYILEYAAVLGDPTSWQAQAITAGMFTAVDHGNCTETLTLGGIEALTGLSGGQGFVRIRADLDEENDLAVDHVSHTGVEGWKRSGVAICCQTYGDPFLHDAIFSGTVEAGGVSGATLDLSTSAGGLDLASLLAGGASYYVEVSSGPDEGHRFDIASAGGAILTLADDSEVDEKVAPFNTRLGAPPASLAGSSVVIRRHRTLDEVFPPGGFVAAASESTADQVQVYSGGSWTIYWLSSDGGSPHWVDTNGSLADMGSTVVPPGQGVWFNSRSASSSLLAVGEVRANRFIRPLAAGRNLVAGGYPVDQAANAAAGREMSIETGFFGSRDFKTADSVFVWKGDAVPGQGGYDTYHQLDGAPVNPALRRWVKVGDASVLPRDGEILFLGNRSVFIRSAAGLSEYGYQSPWNP